MNPSGLREGVTVRSIAEKSRMHFIMIVLVSIHFQLILLLLLGLTSSLSSTKLLLLN